MSLFAWHKILLTHPDDWAPHRLTGDEIKGTAEFSDLRHTRLGLQWETLKHPPKDLGTFLHQTLRAEIGDLAADEATAFNANTLLYEDNDPPKRDVAVTYAPEMKRVIKLIAPINPPASAATSTRRDSTLRTLLPNLSVHTTGDIPWSVFDLSLTTPPDWQLQNHRLNVGDHQLTFRIGRHDFATLRLIAPASLALERIPLAGWLRTSARVHSKHYRIPPTQPDITSLTAPRRRRFFWKRSLPSTIMLHIKHLTERDRLLITTLTDSHHLDYLVNQFT